MEWVVCCSVALSFDGKQENKTVLICFHLPGAGLLKNIYTVCKVTNKFDIHAQFF